MQEQMSQWDYEKTANLFTSLTDEQKWVVVGQIPDNMLWDELYNRYKHKSETLTNIQNAARA
jgi:hypothetical protein